MIKVFSDGSNSAGGLQTKCSIVVYKNYEIIHTLTRIGPPGWSDVAEYLGIVTGLEWLINNDYQNEQIEWFNDSQFVIRQLQGKNKINFNKAYGEYALQAQQLKLKFKQITFNWIPREQNTVADSLSKI